MILLDVRSEPFLYLLVDLEPSNVRGWVRKIWPISLRIEKIHRSSKGAWGPVVSKEIDRLRDDSVTFKIKGMSMVTVADPTFILNQKCQYFLPSSLSDRLKTHLCCCEEVWYSLGFWVLNKFGLVLNEQFLCLVMSSFCMHFNLLNLRFLTSLELGLYPVSFFRLDAFYMSTACLLLP